MLLFIMVFYHSTRNPKAISLTNYSLDTQEHAGGT